MSNEVDLVLSKSAQIALLQYGHAHVVLPNVGSSKSWLYNFWAMPGCFLYLWWMFAVQSVEGQLFFGLHTSCVKTKFRYSGPIRQLPLTWLIYSESYGSSPLFYQLFIFTPKRLKMKFAFSNLIRQLLLTWHIYLESYEYCPFPIKS